MVKPYRLPKFAETRNCLWRLESCQFSNGRRPLKNGAQQTKHPVIIKYPFWQMTAKNPSAAYACINQGQAVCPREIERQSICIDADIGAVIHEIMAGVGVSKSAPR